MLVQTRAKCLDDDWHLIEYICKTGTRYRIDDMYLDETVIDSGTLEGVADFLEEYSEYKHGLGVS